MTRRPDKVLGLISGAVLLAAATGKFVSGSGLSLVGAAGAGQVAGSLLLAAELCLGIWLASGWLPLGSHVAAIHFFGVATVLGLARMIDGQSRCGCFGDLELPGWSALIMSVFLAGGLLWSLPRAARMSGHQPGGGNPVLNRPGLTVTAAVLVVWAGIALLALFWQMPVSSALARLRGNAVALEPSVAGLGQLDAGSVRKLSVAVRNVSGRSVQLVGAEESCGLRVETRFPVVIPPRGLTHVDLIHFCSRTSGRFVRQSRLFLDASQQSSVPLIVSGQVVGGL